MLKFKKGLVANFVIPEAPKNNENRIPKTEKVNMIPIE